MSRDVDEMAQCNAKVFGKVTGSSRFEKHHKAPYTIGSYYLSVYLALTVKIYRKCDKLLDFDWIKLLVSNCKVVM
jgi:hypothetical protein